MKWQGWPQALHGLFHHLSLRSCRTFLMTGGAGNFAISPLSAPSASSAQHTAVLKVKVPPRKVQPPVVQGVRGRHERQPDSAATRRPDEIIAKDPICALTSDSAEFWNFKPTFGRPRRQLGCEKLAQMVMEVK